MFKIYIQKSKDDLRPARVKGFLLAPPSSLERGAPIKIYARLARRCVEFRGCSGVLLKGMRSRWKEKEHILKCVAATGKGCAVKAAKSGIRLDKDLKIVYHFSNM